MNLLAALIFFTRLPFWRLKEVPSACFKRVVPYWPLVGWLTGGIMAGTLWLAAQVMPITIAWIVAIVSRLLVTGCLHEDGLADFFDEVLISEHLGVEKPNAKIFQMALRKLGIENPAKVLVVGDSLSADIQGGMNAGLDTCWVNFLRAENNAGVQPKYEIRTFEELYPIIMEPDELQNVGSKNRKHMTDAL